VSGSPEELLRSALEKIVFFECRVASLEHELEAAHAVALRAREEAQGARRREGELEALLAQSRGEQAVSGAHNGELAERVRLLEAERERFLSGMVERARVSGAPADDGGEPGSESDLAGFISELRGEIESLRAWKRAAEEAGARVESEAGARMAPTPMETTGASASVEEAAAAPEPTATSSANAISTSPSPSPRASGERVGERGELPAPTPVPLAIKAVALPAPSPTPIPRAPAANRTDSLSTLATRMGAQGRLGVAPGDARALSPAFTTRSERALYERSLDDLASSDADARRRAADCLRVLGSPSATPLVAAALGREGDASVKAALLAALGALAEPGAADLAARELGDARPQVRAAALEAAAALGRAKAVPHLARGLADASPLVRRRAAILLGFAAVGEADDALAAALSDRDPGVARAAAAALAGRPSARAQGALAKALDHPEPAVRTVAARAVARWAGEAPDAAAPRDERRRASRRIAEKLLGIDGGALRSAVTHVPRAQAYAPPPPPSKALPSPSLRKGEARGEGGPSSTVTVTVDASLCDAAVAELRAALRGRTPDELASALGRDRPTVEATLAVLVQGGRATRRGPRFFTS
jgi:hypothetical protein